MSIPKGWLFKEPSGLPAQRRFRLVIVGPLSTVKRLGKRRWDEETKNDHRQSSVVTPRKIGIRTAIKLATLKVNIAIIASHLLSYLWEYVT